MDPASTAAPQGSASGVWRWIDRNILDLGRQMRLSYLPPLMIYLAAGIQGLTAIVGTFFIKEYLGLSAEFLAALGFWVMIPWALKMPLGHLVDLIWRHKAGLVYLGAMLIAASLLIMVGLLGDPEAMRRIMRAEAWFVLSAVLAPVGFVLQDVVADAMTVEAVPRFDAAGNRVPEEERRLSNTTMQILGRVAIIGGTVIVSIANVALFQGVEAMDAAQKAAVYQRIYTLALLVPLLSIAGVAFAGYLRRRHARNLAAQGYKREQVRAMQDTQGERPHVNWWLLGGGLVFVVFTLSLGLSDIPYNQEIIFAGSLAIVVFLMAQLIRELDPLARNTLVGTALLVFVFRAMPGVGPGADWWMIDVLKFDQQFFAKLALITSVLTLLGMFLFRRFIAEHSMAYVLGFLTIALALLSLPGLGMYYGLHEWTARHTGGLVDARFIAVVDTTLASPLGQIAMIPMLAWIANTAPNNLKATYFAVMASFTNLALSLSQLGTKYLNKIFVVSREVKDAATGAISTPADYSQLGDLMIVALVIGFVVPMLAIVFVRSTRWRSA